MQKEFKFNDNYYQKTYAGWLGKIIGIRMGSQIEGMTNKDILDKYGEIDRYVKEYNDYAADDDSNGPLFFIRALYDFYNPNLEISTDNMRETWLNYICDEHGFFWWGGYGISTEHTAYKNIKHGIKSPKSGSIELNGASCAQQIGGQIFIDSWGFIFPGNPQKAADFAEKMISVSHDKDGIYGGKFITACISGAYISTSIEDILNYGLSVIPTNCHYAYVVKQIVKFYNNDREKKWQNCLKFIQDNFGYDKYPGNCHIIPNAAIIILSLLYGNDDYSLSQKICNTCGWDTDCNAGNLGAILGVYLGIEKIDNHWIKPIKDIVLASSAIGYLNIETISNSAKFFCDLGCLYNKKAIPKYWNERIVKDMKIICFDMIKSTGGLRCEDNTKVENSSYQVLKGHRSLKLSNTKTNQIESYIKTYYSPSDLEDSRYDPGFSPIAYPGQEIEALIYNPNNYNISAAIFFEDKHTGTKYYSDFKNFEANSTKTFRHKIEKNTDYLISKIGISFKSNSQKLQPMNIYLDKILILGKPNYKIDFSKEIIENYGFSNGKLHLEIRGCTFSNGLWELVENKLIGSCYEQGEILFGYYYSKNISYKCNIMITSGNRAFINFGVQGLARCYSFGFNGDNKIALIKKKINKKILIEKDYNFKKNKLYKFKVQKEENKISCFINDELVINYIDVNNPYEYGQQGMSIYDTCRCEFSNIKIN